MIKVDEFEVQWGDLGGLIDVRVGHDNSGQGPAWHLEQIDITDTKTQQVCLNVWMDGCVDALSFK